MIKAVGGYASINNDVDAYGISNGAYYESVDAVMVVLESMRNK